MTASRARMPSPSAVAPDSEPGIGDGPAAANALTERGGRALTDPIDVYADDPAASGGGEVAVYSGGRRYIVDLEAGSCDCPDHTHRTAVCKHLRRVAFETGRWSLPKGMDVRSLDASLARALGVGRHAPSIRRRRREMEDDNVK